MVGCVLVGGEYWIKNVENCLVYLSLGVSSIAAKSSPIY